MKEREKENQFLSQTCCFSGHRDIPKAELPVVKEKLKNTIENAIHLGYRFFGTGGARGFDTIAAQMVLLLKDTYPQIRLILVLPCEAQTRGWGKKDIEVYEEIKRSADKVVYTSKDYYEGCMRKRNRHLVDHSSLCICYMTNERSGTGYTVEHAKKQGRKVINLISK